MALSKIKILHFIPLFDTGGTEKVVMDIYKGLDPSFFESHVCTFFPGEYDRFFKDNRHLRHVLVGDELRPPLTPIGKVVNLVTRLNHLRQVVRDTGVQLVHTHHLGPLLHIWLLQAMTHQRLPWVHTEHNVPDLAKGYAQPVFRSLKPLRRPGYVTGVSPNVCDYMSSKCAVPEDRVRLVANGVDLDRFAVSTGREEIRTELGIAPDDEVIGCIGNLRQEKNQQLAIEAVALLHQKRPRLKLIICGDGDLRDDLENLAHSLDITDRTFFLGYRFDIPQILAALDLFCLPSVYEGMPVSVLEAWAANKAVVATDVIGIRDLVTQGRTGMLVSPDQPQSMAEAIESLLSAPSEMEQMAAKGRNLVTKYYSLEAMIAQYTNLYKSLLGK